jgi:hypothetical protein
VPGTPAETPAYARIAAVQAGDDVAAGRVLAEGAGPDVMVGRFRGSVLNKAARSDWQGIVGPSVYAGAHVGPAGRFNVWPPRTAVLEAHADVVRYLVARGAP